MSGEQSSEEKSEDPTPRKLRKAKEKGQVAKSKDLNTAVLLMGAFLFLLLFKDYILGTLKGFLTTSFQVSQITQFQDHDLYNALLGAGTALLKVLAPFTIVLFMIAAFAGFMQVGGLFTTEPLKPQINKLNPVQGFKNLFKLKNVVELIKNTVKLSAVGFIGYQVVKSNLAMIVMTSSVPPKEATPSIAIVLTSLMLKVGGLLLFIAILDYLYQKWQHEKDLRMTKYEVKKEYKEDEGDPEIKGKRKQLHQEFAMTDMLSAVQKADVVVVNPTHVAVAIAYDKDDMGAPQVVAKGQRLFAQQIRELAEEFEVPIYRDVPLAWTLLRLEIGHDLPEDLYEAVAEILFFVYRLKAQQEDVLNQVLDTSTVQATT